MLKRMIIMLLLVGLLFGGIFGFQIFKSKMIKKWIAASGVQPVTVSTMKVDYQKWPQTIQASGSLRAARGVDVTTEFAGMVRSIEFQAGSTVKEGALLVKLNDDSEIARLNSLQAAVDLAKKTYDRDAELYKSRTVSKQTLDIDEANLKSTMAQLEEQKAILAKKSIVAPFGGNLGISYINPGQYLSPGDKIVTLQNLDPIYVDFYLPQQFVISLRKGQKFDLTTNAFPGKTFPGEVTTIDPKVDPATRNIQLEGSMKNPDQSLLPGMFGKVEVTIGEPKALLTLPQSAISFNPYGEIVYVIKEGEKDKEGKPTQIAQSVFVKVGEKRGDQASILEGLQAGDIVVTSGQLKLKNGSVVVINNKVQPSHNPTPSVKDE